MDPELPDEKAAREHLARLTAGTDQAAEEMALLVRAVARVRDAALAEGFTREEAHSLVISTWMLLLGTSLAGGGDQ